MLFGLSSSPAVIEPASAPERTGRAPEVTPPPRAVAARVALPGVPHRSLYLDAGRAHGVSPLLLAAIGALETDHGRVELPGVSSGLNEAGCCAGPMQICIVSSCGDVFSTYAVDGDRDGVASVYAHADAIATAAALLAELKGQLGPSPALLLASYNAGPGAVAAAGGVPDFPETQAYVEEGLGLILHWRQPQVRPGGGPTFGP